MPNFLGNEAVTEIQLAAAKLDYLWQRPLVRMFASKAFCMNATPISVSLYRPAFRTASSTAWNARNTSIRVVAAGKCCPHALGNERVQKVAIECRRLGVGRELFGVLKCLPA